VAETFFAPAEEAAPRRRPLLGYTMVWTAAALFAVNGTVSKVVLESGITPVQLTEVRSAGACVAFALALLLMRPGALRVRPAELPFLAAFGIAGVAFVQWLYFVAIHRLPVGIALLIQYIGPLLVALWARFVLHEHVRRRMWVALVLAITGLSLIVEVWTGSLELDELGVLAALGAAVAYAVYVLMAEQGVRTRDPVSLSCYGFLFAALFWLVVAPPWEFPAGRLGDSVSLLGNLERFHAPVWLLTLGVIVLGTTVTFGLIVASLRHVSATRVGIIAMLEPVGAALVAWLWLGETLGAGQLVGGAIVLVGIVLAQTAR
jgi:drug/metabolite transporter (DMT)-like permease